jgi:hypothetical protein
MLGYIGLADLEKFFEITDAFYTTTEFFKYMYPNMMSTNP